MRIINIWLNPFGAFSSDGRRRRRRRFLGRKHLMPGLQLRTAYRHAARGHFIMP